MEYQTPKDVMAVYPDYEMWFSKDTWTMAEAAALTVGLCPNLILEASSFLQLNIKILDKDDGLCGDLDTYSAEFGDWQENLQERYNAFSNAYCAGDFLLPTKKQVFGYEPLGILQWCYDEALPFHFKLSEFMAQNGICLTFSANSHMLYQYNNYCKKDRWSLTVGARLILGLDPEGGRLYLESRKNYNRHIDPNYAMTKRDEVYHILELAEESHEQGKLRFIQDPLIGIEFGYRDPEECTVVVTPEEFINWVIGKKFTPPVQLLELMGLCTPTLVKKLEPIANAMIEDLQPLKNNQRHKERCRAIAEMLWSRDPSIPISQMADHDAIIEFGCEGKVYKDDETVRGWIKDLHPNPQVGRPKKKLPV